MIGLKCYEEALEIYDKILDLDQNYKKAWYDKACVESLQGNKDKAMYNLEKAINLDSKYKEKAKREPDFINIKNMSAFKLLTTP